MKGVYLVVKIIESKEKVVLQLIAKEIDIAKVSKLLVKYNVDASISNGVINLSDKTADEIINVLGNEIEILSVEKNNIGLESDNSEILYRGDYKIIDKTENYDLKYPVVKRGEIYLCDCGNGYGSEIMGIRFALIIQDDVANLHSASTIIVPITSKLSRYPNAYNLVFSETTLVDFDPAITGTYKNASFLCGQIKTVDKKRLRNYIGTLKDEVVEKIDEIVKISLQLNGENA